MWQLWRSWQEFIFLGQSLIRHCGTGMFMTCETVICESLQPVCRHPYKHKYFSTWSLEKNSNIKLHCNSRDFIFEVKNKIHVFWKKTFFPPQVSEESEVVAPKSNCRQKMYLYFKIMLWDTSLLKKFAFGRDGDEVVGLPSYGYVLPGKMTTEKQVRNREHNVRGKTAW